MTGIVGSIKNLPKLKEELRLINEKITGIAEGIKKLSELEKELKIINEKMSAAFSNDEAEYLKSIGEKLQTVIGNVETTNIVNKELLRQKYLEKIPADRLEHCEYSVYSQNGEDGIISEIFSRIGCSNKTFVEFGVGNGTENNTVYLLSSGWTGLWIEAMEGHCSVIKDIFRSYLEKKSLFLENEFVCPDNINDLISAHFTNEVGLLSIDIDGYDYDIWKAINCISPRVVVTEYNSTFPPPCKVHVPYAKEHFWRSDNYFGMSLTEARLLGEEKGYVLVGTDLHGVNAFFVRKDIFDINKSKFNYLLDDKSLFNPPRYWFLPSYRGHRNSFKFPEINAE